MTSCFIGSSSIYSRNPRWRSRPPGRILTHAMLDDALGRRAFLTTSCTAIASAWLAADPDQLRASLAHARARANAPPPLWEILTPDQAADVDAIAAQIIPTDDLPGARE